LCIKCDINDFEIINKLKLAIKNKFGFDYSGKKINRKMYLLIITTNF